MALPLKTKRMLARSLRDYRERFALDELDLTKKILDCPAGPASFNYELTVLGGCVLSVDPIYAMRCEDLEAQYGQRQGIPQSVLNCTAGNPLGVESITQSLWPLLASSQQRAAELFLADFVRGRRQGRYRCESLPFLPFANEEFELALCQSSVFSRDDEDAETFDTAALLELCRVAKEVRVVTVTTATADLPPYLQQLIAFLLREGIEAKMDHKEAASLPGYFYSTVTLKQVFCPLRTHPVVRCAEMMY